MKNYKNIAVIYSSDSSEWEVSCRSGKFTASQIDGTKYDVYEIFARFGQWNVVAMRPKGGERVEFAEGEAPQVDKTDFSAVIGGVRVKFDYAYIMQHGIPGENGQMQGYLEMLRVPFSSCSAFVSAITFDKFSCKSYLKDVDFVKVAKDLFIRRGESLEGLADKAVAKLGLRCGHISSWKSPAPWKSLRHRAVPGIFLRLHRCTSHRNRRIHGSSQSR